MHKVPEIRTSHPAIAVDAMFFRAPLFGLFGTPSWEVHWRSSKDPERSGTSIVPCGATNGRAELHGQPFTYVARWRDSEPAAGDLDGHIVTPGSVLRLAEFAQRR
jgi:hypothetical protein